MNVVLSFFFFASAFCMVCAASIKPSTRVVSDSCRPNICFALDGSGSSSMDEYARQGELTIIVAASFGSDGAFVSAVQYGNESVIISPTTQDIDQFRIQVGQSVSLGAPRTSIEAAISSCSAQLAGQADNPTELVLLGDGISNAGDDALVVAQRFREQFGSGGRLHTVGVGISDTEQLVAIATAGGGSSFREGDWLGVADVIFERVLRCDSGEN